MTLNNRTYDVLKWIAQYLLPAMGTLYFALAMIWGLPFGQEVVGTITAIDAFLGMVLGLSTASYQGDGTLTIGGVEDKVEINTSLEELAAKKSVTLMVAKDDDAISELAEQKS